MSAIDVIALVTGAIGYALGWLSHEIRSNAEEVQIMLMAADRINKLTEEKYR